MNPEDFFYFAQEMLQQKQDSTYTEAKLRSVISRGYYGTILYFRDTIQNIIGREIKGGIHKYIPAILRSVEIQDLSTLASLLESLKQERTRADYHIKKTGVGRKKAEDYLEKCKNARKHFANIINSNKVKFEDALKKYSKIRPP